MRKQENSLTENLPMTTYKVMNFIFVKFYAN